MAWQQRGDKRYLYRSVKRQGRVIREYVGTGPVAEAMAAVEAHERAQRQATRDTQRALLADLDAHAQAMQVWWAQEQALLTALFYAKGLYRHDRSLWRKRATPE
jgi:hypothetical protein